MALFTEGKLFRKAGEGSGGGGGDQHNLGWYATESALITAHPTADDGDYAIVGSTDTVWTWDSDTSAWVDSDQKGQVTSVNGQTGAVTVSEVPSQTGHSGEFLTTDGTDASWSDKPLVNNTTSNDSLQILGTGSTDVNCVCIGPKTRSKQSSCVTIGTNSFIDGTVVGAGLDVAIGVGAQIYGKNQTFIGANTNDTYNSNAQYCVGIGAQACTSGAVKGAIQIGKGTNSESGTLYVGRTTDGTNFTNTKLLDSDGTIPTARLTNAINKYSSMPTASADYLGQIVQFTGTTDATYTHGYIYECMSDGGTPATYSWTAVSVQAGGSSLPSQTGNAGKFLKTDGTDVSWGEALVNKANFSTSASTVINMNGTVPTNFNNVIIGGAITYTSSAQGVVSLSSSYDGSKPVGSYGISITGLAMGLRSCAIGAIAKAYTKDSIAIGTDASATGESAIAIGKNCATNANGAIQIGSSSTLQTNSNANTFKVANANGNYEIMSADGTIPTDRFTTTPSADGTYYPTLSISSGTPTRSWGTISALQNQGTVASNLNILGDTGAAQIGTNATSIGYYAAAKSNYSTAIGASSGCDYAYAVALGESAYAAGNHAVAIGANAEVAYGAAHAIQIGATTNTSGPTINSDANTFKVANENGNFEIMSADGTVPTARLTKVNSTITLTSAGWSSNTQTVNVSGMTATGVVLVSPDPTDQADYTSAGIICTSQATNSLTFTCSTTPSSDIDVVVVML